MAASHGLLLPVDGEFPTYAEIRLRPTQQRVAVTAQVGWPFRRRYRIHNRGVRMVRGEPFALNFGRTDGLVSYSMMQADGDDVRVLINGIEVARTLNTPNSSTDMLVWFILPAIDAGGFVDIDVVFGNPTAGPPPPLVAGTDKPAFDVDTTGTRSTKITHIYKIDDVAANAGGGLWPLSSGTSQPHTISGAPGAWQQVDSRSSNDDRKQTAYRQYVDTGTYYQATFNATRARSGSAVIDDLDTGTDGVVLTSDVGIESVTANFVWENLAQGEVNLTPVGKLVVLCRDEDGDPWEVLYSNDSLVTTPTALAPGTLTPSSPKRQVAFAVWPHDGIQVNEAARSDRYIAARLNDTLTVTLANVLVKEEITDTLWSPADYGAPLVWLKADAITGLNDGDPIASWTDGSGNGRNATQATAANRPLYKERIRDGLPVVRFDGVNDELDTASLGTAAQPFTVVVVAKDNGVAAAGTIVRGGNWTINRGGAGNNDAVANLGADFQYSTNTLATGGWHIHFVNFNGASSVGAIDGTEAAGNVGASAPTGVLAVGDGTFMSQDIAEVIVVSGSPTSMQRSQFEGYLAWKWGLQGSLPSTHPYRQGPPVITPWTPAEEAGYYAAVKPSFWLKADAINQADNTSLSTWSDSSGNGRNFTQGAAGQRPTFQTNEINGLPIARFDGVDDNLTFDDVATPSIGMNKPCTLFAVIKFGAGVVGSDNFVNGAGIQMFINPGAGDNDFALYGGASGGGGSFIYGTDKLDTAVHLHMGVFNGATSIGGFDGGWTAGAIGTDATDWLVLGASPGGTNAPAADWGEVVGLQGVPHASVVARYEGYLARKWGIVANLPTAHPYRTRDPMIDEVYEYATELRVNGGGGATPVPPYTRLLIGNYLEADGAGTPRVFSRVGEQVVVFSERRTMQVWNAAYTVKREDLNIDLVQALGGSLTYDGMTMESPAAEWLLLLPVVNPLPNPSFAADLTGWTETFVHANITRTRTRDAIVFSDAAGSLKTAISASTALADALLYRDEANDFLPIGGRQNFQVAMDVRASSLSLDSYVTLYFYDQDEAFISASMQSLVDGNLSVVNTWYRRIFAALAPEGAAFAKIVRDVYAVTPNQTGDTWMDNVSVNDTDLVVRNVSAPDGGMSIVYRLVPRYAYG